MLQILVLPLIDLHLFKTGSTWNSNTPATSSCSNPADEDHLQKYYNACQERCSRVKMSFLENSLFLMDS